MVGPPRAAPNPGFRIGDRVRVFAFSRSIVVIIHAIGERVAFFHPPELRDGSATGWAPFADLQRVGRRRARPRKGAA